MTSKSDDLAVQDQLDRLVESALALTVLLGDGNDEAAPSLPDEAIDAALRTDETYQQARATFRARLTTLLVGAGDDVDLHPALLGIEETANAMTSAAADAGFRIGSKLGGRGR